MSAPTIVPEPMAVAVDKARNVGDFPHGSFSPDAVGRHRRDHGHRHAGDQRGHQCVHRCRRGWSLISIHLVQKRQPTPRRSLSLIDFPCTAVAIGRLSPTMSRVTAARHRALPVRARFTAGTTVNSANGMPVPTGICAVATGLPRRVSHHPAQYEPASDKTLMKLNASAPKRPAAKSLIVAGGGPSHSWT